MKFAGLFLTACILAAPGAFAQTPGDTSKGERAHRMHQHFKVADKNGDGKFSREEASASLPRIARNFDQIDTNKDGQITREELKAFREKRRAERVN